MNKFILKTCLLSCCFILYFHSISFAQMGGQKHLEERLNDFEDSLKQIEYPYIFPILGQKLLEKGFDFPYPFGIMANYVLSRQDIEIPQIGLSFSSPNELIDVSDITRFESTKVNVNTFNLRPDVWVLPFLNVYGLLGYIGNETTVKLKLPFELEAVSESTGPYYGIGLLLAGGVGPVWFSLDYNQVWVKPDVLDKASRARVNGFRMGHTFVSRKNPQRNIAIWVGAQYQKLASDTEGSVELEDIFNVSPEKRQELNESLTAWYNSLPPAQQKIVAPIVEKFGEFLVDAKNSTIYYNLQKDLKFPWSMAVGAQLQFSKRWQFRTEYNFLGSRQQFMLSLNYRFGVKGHNIASGRFK